jgi:hypothetical protein
MAFKISHLQNGAQQFRPWKFVHTAFLDHRDPLNLTARPPPFDQEIWEVEETR